MARKLRVEYPGATYHMMNCDRREPILKDDLERQRSVETRVTVAWIAERLQMGSVANVNTLLNQWRQTRK